MSLRPGEYLDRKADGGKEMFLDRGVKHLGLSPSSGKK
jgi:hypothetical protein